MNGDQEQLQISFGFPMQGRSRTWSGLGLLWSTTSWHFPGSSWELLPSHSRWTISQNVRDFWQNWIIFLCSKVRMTALHIDHFICLFNTCTSRHSDTTWVCVLHLIHCMFHCVCNRFTLCGSHLPIMATIILCGPTYILVMHNGPHNTVNTTTSSITAMVEGWLLNIEFHYRLRPRLLWSPIPSRSRTRVRMASDELPTQSCDLRWCVCRCIIVTVCSRRPRRPA